MAELLQEFSARAADAIVELVAQQPTGAFAKDASGRLVGVAVSRPYFETMKGLLRAYDHLTEARQSGSPIDKEAVPVYSPAKEVLAYLFSEDTFKRYQNHIEAVGPLVEKADDLASADDHILSVEETDAFLNKFSP